MMGRTLGMELPYPFNYDREHDGKMDSINSGKRPINTYNITSNKTKIIIIYQKFK